MNHSHYISLDEHMERVYAAATALAEGIRSGRLEGSLESRRLYYCVLSQHSAWERIRREAKEHAPKVAAYLRAGA